MISVPIGAGVAYCGYLCSACPGSCPGCKAGGGDADCPQKACCAGRGLQGCWECNEFPCAKGPYGSNEWRGLSVGCAQCVKALGPALYAERVAARMGSPIDFSAYSGKTAEQVVALLCHPEG